MKWKLFAIVIRDDLDIEMQKEENRKKKKRENGI